MVEWNIVSIKLTSEKVVLVSKAEIQLRDFMLMFGLSRKTRIEINKEIKKGVLKNWAEKEAKK